MGSSLPENDTKRRIQQIKNGLVLQVAAEDGAFFDEVHEVRTRWDIEAPTQLPPEDRNLLYPERIQQAFQGEAQLAGQHIHDTHDWELDIKRLWLWLAVPGLKRYRLDLDWWPFMAALVLFRPPLDRLSEFAKYGGIVRKDPFAEYGATLRNDPEFRRKEAATSHDPALVSPLISTFPNPYSYGQVWQDYYETLMEEINERFLKPQGLQIDEMRDEVLRDGTLDESMQERLRQIPQDLYIAVPKNVKVDELREAVSLTAPMREEHKEEASTVEVSDTELKKVEIAYRRDHLGQDYKSLEGHYSDLSTETIKTYARDGRKILNGTG